MSNAWVEQLLTFHCPGVCPHESCFVSVVRGFRHGFVYGCKIRAPHAFVMSFLFGRGSVNDKLKYIAEATFSHAKNLGTFVALYKLLLCLLRHVRKSNDGINPFIAGFIAAVPVWARESPISSQINMYVLSRIIFGLVRYAAKQQVLPVVPGAFRWSACLIWGTVMCLFHVDRKVLQGSLERSMVYLYEESDTWPSMEKLSVLDMLIL
eukprot:gb/GEZN01020589.1/.p1 GENE.gb/GEZN01020589.1/~~gb/GEZN01020589.1/.p1  ORF type:complete len:215 (-),score=7.34 gb/GEZN01020589.1/:34-657(-)